MLQCTGYGAHCRRPPERRASSRGPRDVVGWRAPARQTAADRGPQQKPKSDGGRARSNGSTRACSRRTGKPSTRAAEPPRRPRSSTDLSAPSRNRSASDDFVSRRGCTWGRDERRRRGGIDLVIIPTRPTSEARIPGAESARGYTVEGCVLPRFGGSLRLRLRLRRDTSTRSLGMTSGRPARAAQPREGANEVADERSRSQDTT